MSVLLFALGETVHRPVATVAVIQKDLDNWHAFSGSALRVKIAQAFCHRADFAVTDDAVVDLGDGGQFAHCACAKHFVRAVDIDNW